MNKNLKSISYSLSDSALGKIAVAKNTNGLCAVLFGNSFPELRKELQTRFSDAKLVEDSAGLKGDTREVLRHIASPNRAFRLPLDPEGTPFQKSVWKALRKIPYGEISNYSLIAQSIGAPKAVRAVAQACGANPIAIIIPCILS